MEYKVLGGNWEKSDQPTKEELILMKIYELESLHFINKIGEPSKLKHPNVTFLREIIDDKENNILSSFVVFKSEHAKSFYYAIRFTHFIQKK